MVGVYKAFSIINSSVVDVAKSINTITPAEDIRINSDTVRLEEEDFVVTERGKRLASQLTVAYDLSSYRKNFCMIESDIEETTLLEQLLQPITDLDLTEFNVEGLSCDYSRKNF